MRAARRPRPPPARCWDFVPVDSRRSVSSLLASSVLSSCPRICCSTGTTDRGMQTVSTRYTPFLNLARILPSTALHPTRLGLAFRSSSSSTAMGDDVAVPRPSARRVATSLRHGSDHVLTAYFFSLILIQKLAERSADGYDYRTLLLQRHATKGSFRSAHVFPGGNIDDADHDPYWRSNASSSDEQEHRPFKVCAVRETFEECGLLAATRNDSLSAEDRTAWRKKVRASHAVSPPCLKLMSCALTGTC